MLGLVPRQGHGIVRRAVLLALVSWLPVAVWAWMRGRALPGQLAEPLLAHYGVHVRCLIAIPLFIIAEGTVHAATRRLVGMLARKGYGSGLAFAVVKEELANAGREPIGTSLDD